MNVKDLTKHVSYKEVNTTEDWKQANGIIAVSYSATKKVDSQGESMGYAGSIIFSTKEKNKLLELFTHRKKFNLRIGTPDSVYYVEIKGVTMTNFGNGLSVDNLEEDEIQGAYHSSEISLYFGPNE